MRATQVLNTLLAGARERKKQRALETVYVELRTIDGESVYGHAYFDASLEAVVIGAENEVYPHYVATDKIVWIREQADA